MKQPLEIMSQKLPGIYKCDLSWPICLFDFSFDNLNPKFVAFKVKADLTSLVILNYFSREILAGSLQVESKPEEHQILQVSDDELLICRSKHICTFGEGGRTFSKAFMDRFLVRDMALMADHNNFMSFDINSEKDTLLKLEGFARYVMQPLNPVLQDRLNRLEPLR